MAAKGKSTPPKAAPAKAAPAKAAPAKAAPARPAPTPAPNAPGGQSFVGPVGSTATANPDTPPPPLPPKDPDVARLEAATGLTLSLTKPPGEFNAGRYRINGVDYWPQVSGQQQYAGGPGITGAQQVLLTGFSENDQGTGALNAEWKQRYLDEYASGGFDHYTGEFVGGRTGPGGAAGANGAPGANGMPGATGTAAADPAKAAADLAQDNANEDAFATIKRVLGEYGLESLAEFAKREIFSGRSGNEVLQDIRETPQFKQRFPAIEARQKAGLPPLSPGDYVSYENTATQYMRDAGLPRGFYDSPEDFTKFLSNDVSLKELSERVNLAKDAAYNAPSEVRSALRGQFGLGDGDLAAFFLDPNRAQPLLQRTFNAAQIAGAGTRTGYDVNAEQDYRLADLGVSAQQAQQGFSQLQQSQELFNPLTGHANEGAITVDQQLGAAFGGNAADQQQIERRRSQRQAEFADGGAFAANQQGLSGLGAASK